MLSFAIFTPLCKTSVDRVFKINNNIYTKGKVEKKPLFLLIFILAKSMLIDEELTDQFLLFEDDESPEILTQEPGDNPSEDTDDEEKDKDEEDD